MPGYGSGPLPADDVRAWFGRFLVAESDQLDVLTVWDLHTHLLDRLTTTPRLVLESPAPEAGKTTCLEHLARLCDRGQLLIPPLSGPLVSRIAAGTDIRVMLLDEWDTVDPKSDETRTVLGISNSGYRYGATRPTLEQGKGGKWETLLLPTYVAMAFSGIGLRQKLPDATASRTLFVELLPAGDQEPEETDWDLLTDGVEDLHSRIRGHAGQGLGEEPALPPEVRGRNRERWKPLFVAAAHFGGQEWADRLYGVCERWLKAEQRDRENGFQQTQTHLAALEAVALCMLERPLLVGEGGFCPTADLLAFVRSQEPFCFWEKQLTATRLGLLLRQVQIQPRHNASKTARGYYLPDVERIATRLGRMPRRVDG